MLFRLRLQSLSQLPVSSFSSCQVQQITEPGPSGYELCDADKAFVLSNIVDIAVHAKGDAKLRNLAIECVRECIHRE